MVLITRLSRYQNSLDFGTAVIIGLSIRVRFCRNTVAKKYLHLEPVQKSKDLSEKQIAHIDSIIAKTKEALAFMAKASKDILEELKYPQNWKKYRQLDYVYEMNELF